MTNDQFHSTLREVRQSEARYFYLKGLLDALVVVSAAAFIFITIKY